MTSWVTVVLPDIVHGEVSSTNEDHFSCSDLMHIFPDKTTQDFHECPKEQVMDLGWV